jgi:hypothetical protein
MCEDKAMMKPVLILAAIIIVSGVAHAISYVSSIETKKIDASHILSEYYTLSVREQYCIYNIRNINSECNNRASEEIAAE